jgi:hypothetical protein
MLHVNINMILVSKFKDENYVVSYVSSKIISKNTCFESLGNALFHTYIFKTHNNDKDTSALISYHFMTFNILWFTI